MTSLLISIHTAKFRGCLNRTPCIPSSIPELVMESSEELTRLESFVHQVSRPSKASLPSTPKGQFFIHSRRYSSPVKQYLARYRPSTWSGPPPGYTPWNSHREPFPLPSSLSPAAAYPLAPPISECPTTSFDHPLIPKHIGYLPQQHQTYNKHQTSFTWWIQCET